MAILDIIIAHKADEKSNAYLSRLLSSIDAWQKNSSCQRSDINIIVVANTRDVDCGKVINYFKDLNIEFVEDNVMSGVYNAYGIGFAHGSLPYCIFLGSDDIILVSFTHILNRLISGDVDLVLTNYIHEEKGIVKQQPSRLFLVFKNWCQQSIIYKRDLLKSLHPLFNQKYKIQADHDLHIRLMKKETFVKIQKFESAPIVFGSSGLSSHAIDYAFKKDMHTIVAHNLGIGYSVLSRLRSVMGYFARKIYRISGYQKMAFHK